MAAVGLKGIVKKFGSQTIIPGLDLEIRNGEFMVLVGPSGCGKSTLLRIIAGLEPVSGGEIAIDGARVNDKSPRARGVAMVFQNYALYPHMTVAGNIAFALKLAGTPRSETDRRVREIATTLRLETLLDKKPGQLSGGQKQRVAIGRAMVRNPAVFLFDEPLSNLDAQLRVTMRAEIAELHKKLGATMVYVTHDQAEAMTLADRIAVMERGRICQLGRPLDVYHQPDSTFVASFIGTPPMNLIPSARIQGLAAPAGAVTAGFRPDDVSTERAGAHAVTVGEGTVTLTELFGPTALVHYRLNGDGPAMIRETRTSSASRGDRHPLWLDPARLHWFDAAGNRVGG